MGNAPERIWVDAVSVASGRLTTIAASTIPDALMRLPYVPEARVREWRELYYALFGTVRNSLREGKSAQQRIEEIDGVLKWSLTAHRALESRLAAEQGAARKEKEDG